MTATRPPDPGSKGARAGRLSDGTPFFGRLGVVAYDRDEDLVQCHLCGRWLRIVGGTHVRWHGWTIERYRAAFELRSNVPTCAPGLSSIERRSAQARIGRGGFATPSPSLVDRSAQLRRGDRWRV